MRNNSYKLNWYYEYNIQEANNKKILSKCTFTYQLCSVISRNLHLFWPTKTPKWSAVTDDRPPFATLDRVSIVFHQCWGFTGCIIFHDSLYNTHLRCQLCFIDQYLNEKMFLCANWFCFNLTGFTSVLI